MTPAYAPGKYNDTTFLQLSWLPPTSRKSKSCRCLWQALKLSAEAFLVFTGIVEHVGRLESIETTGAGGRIRVRAGALAANLAIAGSIAVNGCCLTVVEVAGELFAADLSAETLRRTGFGEMAPGKQLNLERPLTAGKELGGHFVQGHVDGVGRVTRLSPEGGNWGLGVRVPA